MQALNFQLLGMILNFDLESLLKLCDTSLCRFLIFVTENYLVRILYV